MNWTQTVLFVISVPGILGAAEPKPKWTVNLTDGSRILGNVPFESLAVRSRIIGDATVAVERIALIETGGEQPALRISLTNGDKLNCTPREKDLPFETLMGRVAIPWDKVTGVITDSAVTEEDLKNGLVAFYPFRVDAEDHSGNLHHGKVQGATFEAGGLRFLGDATSFVRIPRSVTLEPQDALTVSMWIKGVPGQAAGKGWGTLLRKMNSCHPGFAIRGGGVSALNLCGENPCAGGHISSASFLPFDENRWQHIAFTCSLGDSLIITYQNGANVNVSIMFRELLHSGDLFIGGANVAADDGGFRGLVRDVRIYDRALKPMEIRALSATTSAP